MLLYRNVVCFKLEELLLAELALALIARAEKVKRTSNLQEEERELEESLKKQGLLYVPETVSCLLC